MSRDPDATGNLCDRIDSKLGYQNGGYDLAPKFSKLFILNGPDEPAIRSFFTPAVLDFFERHPKYSLEASGDTIFFYHTRKLCQPEELKDLLAQAREASSVLTEATA